MATNILVVGGTGFLGGAIADAALAAGHRVSILSRGLKAAGNPDIHYIGADRLGPLDALRTHKFDLVFDTCAFTPNSVQHVLAAVGGDLSRYMMISSASVYGDWSRPGLDENDPVPEASQADLRHALEMERSAQLSADGAGDSYGPLKRNCELMAERLLGARAISLRAGLLVGAGD